MSKGKSQDQKTETEEIESEEDKIEGEQKPDSNARKRKKENRSAKNKAKKTKVDTGATIAADSESESDEDEDGSPVPLLDQSPEITGTRIRKQVQRLSVNPPAVVESPGRRKNEFLPGRGMKLATSPKIVSQLQTVKQSEMTLLHRLLFKRPGTTHEIKRNIREFSGFWFSKEDKEFKNRKQTLEKQTLTDIKFICQLLGLEKTGTKEIIVERVLDFLLCPELNLDPIKTPKSKKSTSKKAAIKGNGAKNVKSKDSNSETYPSSEEEESLSKQTIKKTPVSKKSKKKLIDSDSHESKEDTDQEESSANKKKLARPRKSQKTPTEKVSKSKPRKRAHSVSEVEETVTSDQEESPKKPQQLKAKKTTRKPPKRQTKKKPATLEKSSDSQSEEEHEEAEEAENLKGKQIDKSTEENKITSEFEEEPEDQRQKVPEKEVPEKEVPERGKKSKTVLSGNSKSEESNSNDLAEGETEKLEQVPEKVIPSENHELEQVESIKEEPTIIKQEEKENSAGPTDDELRVTIQEILKDADMENHTLKMLSQKVYARYPNSNLELTKKDFIRSTAKSLLISSEAE